jgi:type II secretory pathway pseudopilin PulG
MADCTTKRQVPPGEEGYILVAVVFMTAILVLALAVAIPRTRESIQRDREMETMQRGKQYIRAVQLYYRKFHSYPPNIDALVKTNNIRFLRKKYVDPTTGKDEWKAVMFGQNKTPQAMGFFGQPLAAAEGAGTGPGGGNGLTGIGAGATPNAGSGLFNSSGGSTDTGNAGTPATPVTPPGTTGASDANGNPTTGGTTTGASGTGTSTGTTGTTGSSNPTSGQTLGGGGIIGFSPQGPKQSLMVYKKKNHYNEWEFLYSPLSDQQQVQGGGNNGTIGQPAGSTTNPVGSPTPSPTPAPPSSGSGNPSPQ